MMEIVEVLATVDYAVVRKLSCYSHRNRVVVLIECRSRSTYNIYRQLSIISY